MSFVRSHRNGETQQEMVRETLAQTGREGQE